MQVTWPRLVVRAIPSVGVKRVAFMRSDACTRSAQGCHQAKCPSLSLKALLVLLGRCHSEGIWSVRTPRPCAAAPCCKRWNVDVPTAGLQAARQQHVCSGAPAHRRVRSSLLVLRGRPARNSIRGGVLSRVNSLCMGFSPLLDTPFSPLSQRLSEELLVTVAGSACLQRCSPLQAWLGPKHA
jgi:hypothetical protein